MTRISHITRNTKETQIELSINLDGTGQADISTGIGFLDHMLTLLTFHSDFDLKIIGHGDHETVGMDPHHLIEDVAIAVKILVVGIGNIDAKDAAPFLAIGLSIVPILSEIALVLSFGDIKCNLELVTPLGIFNLSF